MKDPDLRGRSNTSSPPKGQDPAHRKSKGIHTITVRANKQLQQDCRAHDQYAKPSCISVR